MRFLIFVVLIYLLYRLVRGLISPGLRPKRGNYDGDIDLMVQDPSCRTYIPQRDAIKQIIKGKVHFFCSKECREKFIKEIESKGEL